MERLIGRWINCYCSSRNHLFSNQQFFMNDFLHSKYSKMRWICGMSRAAIVLTPFVCQLFSKGFQSVKLKTFLGASPLDPIFSMIAKFFESHSLRDYGLGVPYEKFSGRATSTRKTSCLLAYYQNLAEYNCHIFKI